MEDDMRKGPVHHRKKPWYSLLLVPVGIALNILVSKVSAALGLPLYLDTLGTVLAAVLGGYLPGILTGYLTNLVNGFNDVTNIYYGSVNALIGVATAFYAQQGYWDKRFRALLTVPVLTLIGGALGSLLTWYLFEFSINLSSPSSAFSLFLYEQGLPIFWAQFHPRYRSLSMRTKLLLLIAAAIISITLGFTLVFDALYHNTIIDENETLATGVAKLAATAFDPDRVDEYLELGEAAPGYREAEAKLQKIRSCSPDLEYIYIYKILPDGCHVVFDLDTAGAPAANPGRSFPLTNPLMRISPTSSPEKRSRRSSPTTPTDG